MPCQRGGTGTDVLYRRAFVKTFGHLNGRDEIELPADSNVVESKWLLKWKSDARGMIDRAKARLVAPSYNQVEEVDYFKTFAPTAPTTSNRLIAAMACKLDWGLRHLDVTQVFIQAELDTEIFLKNPPGYGEMSGKVVLLNKALYGLKQSGRSWYKLLSSTLVECGFEQCLVDPRVSVPGRPARVSTDFE